MGSAAYFAKLANFQAAINKPNLVPFNLFNAADNLAFIAAPPANNQLSQTTLTSAASTLSVDTSLAQVITIVLQAAVTTMTLAYSGQGSVPNGYATQLRFNQPASGSTYAVTLPANLTVPSGFAVSTANGTATVIPILWNGAQWICGSDPFTTGNP